MSMFSYCWAFIQHSSRRRSHVALELLLAELLLGQGAPQRSQQTVGSHFFHEQTCLMDIPWNEHDNPTYQVEDPCRLDHPYFPNLHRVSCGQLLLTSDSNPQILLTVSDIPIQQQQVFFFFPSAGSQAPSWARIQSNKSSKIRWRPSGGLSSSSAQVMYASPSLDGWQLFFHTTNRQLYYNYVFATLKTS